MLCWVVLGKSDLAAVKWRSGGSRAERWSAGERSSEDYLGIPEPKQIIVPDGEKDGLLRDLTHKHVMRYADWGTPCEFIV